ADSADGAIERFRNAKVQPKDHPEADPHADENDENAPADERRLYMGDAGETRGGARPEIRVAPRHARPPRDRPPAPFWSRASGRVQPAGRKGSLDCCDGSAICLRRAPRPRSSAG